MALIKCTGIGPDYEVPVLDEIASELKKIRELLEKQTASVVVNASTAEPLVAKAKLREKR